ncbi:hypothetical protein bcere0007_54140 [Bacillus mycoides]|nr:hypothetical protein [Bacillus mycoides]EEK70141.1 hypothetical protein bcere0007_54140 [Bacillus mycoides]
MNTLEHYPSVLDVVHIQEILGIGRRIKVLKTVFISWLEGSDVKEGI